MGQRHQLFIKIANPLKHISTSDSAVKAKLKNLFGSDEFTILPFHNQWLYGRAALQVALNMLNHAFQFTREDKTSTKSWSGNNTPICPNGMRYHFGDPEKLISAITFIQNYIPTNTDFIEAGFSGSWYLGNTEPDMRHDFRNGDNNDGITIIDVVENKYCFMNISQYKSETNELFHSASDLTYLFPSSAHDYVKCYYGETVKTLNQYHLERGVENGKTARQLASEFRNDNNKLVRQFAKFEVLGIGEVLEMFPLVKRELGKKDLVIS